MPPVLRRYYLCTQRKVSRMIDPTEHDDFTLYTGSGELPPDPEGLPPDADVDVPPLAGLADKIRSLRKGQFVASNVPDVAKRTVARRMESVRYKVVKAHPDREFTVSTEWFGVTTRRVR